MKRKENSPHRFETLSELHRVLGLPKPMHPLISLVENKDNEVDLARMPNSFIHDFYKISYKTKLTGKIKYGQGYYDFDEGGMLFKAPNQVSAKGEVTHDHSGFTLLFHPDFLAGYPLAKKIKQYGFFSYSVSEALHLSDKEKTTIIGIFKNIEEELQNRIDDFSHDIVISQIETLLNYCNRFYKRQFITRKSVNSSILEKLEEILDEYFSKDKPLTQGIPTVQYLADCLNISPSYLSDMLRSVTGQNAQQHIHNKLIEIAKEKISTTSLTISEIAYELGFEHPSSFNKLFKSKTKLSPLAFRQSFN
jgi:AraC-type DNA-binding domain-containing proteins